MSDNEAQFSFDSDTSVVYRAIRDPASGWISIQFAVPNGGTYIDVAGFSTTLKPPPIEEPAPEPQTLLDMAPVPSSLTETQE